MEKYTYRSLSSFTPTSVFNTLIYFLPSLLNNFCWSMVAQIQFSFILFHIVQKFFNFSFIDDSNSFFHVNPLFLYEEQTVQTCNRELIVEAE